MGPLLTNYYAYILVKIKAMRLTILKKTYFRDEQVYALTDYFVGWRD
jgi:hypothetical protein